MSSTAENNSEKGLLDNLVSKIQKFLKLDDEGKIKTFLNRIIKQYNTAITNKKQNLATLELKHRQEVSQIEDRIEDAEQAVDEAYLNVDLDRLKNNESQIEYADDYMYQINSAYEKVDRLKKEKEDLIDTYNKNVEKLNKEIDAIKVKISRLTDVK